LIFFLFISVVFSHSSLLLKHERIAIVGGGISGVCE